MLWCNGEKTSVLDIAENQEYLKLESLVNKNRDFGNIRHDQTQTLEINFMEIGIGIVIGLLLGAIATYFLSSSGAKRKLQSTESKLERTENALTEAENQLKELQDVPAKLQQTEQMYEAKLQDMGQRNITQEEELSQATQKIAELQSLASRVQELEHLETKAQEIEQNYEAQLQHLEQKYQSEIQELQQTLANSQSIEETEQRIRELQGAYQTQIENYQVQVQELQQAQASSQSIEETEQRIREIEQAYQTQIQDLQQSHQQAVADLENAHRHQQDEREEANQTQIREIQASYQAQIVELEQSHQENIQALQEQQAVSPVYSENVTDETVNMQVTGLNEGAIFKSEQLTQEETSKTFENDTDNFLEELSVVSGTVTEDVIADDELELFSTSEEGNIDSIIPEDNISDDSEVLKDLLTEEADKDDQDFLEMMPTSEEQSDHLQETIAASDENDPFADIFESDSDSNQIDPNDPFAELLGDGTETPDEEFLNLLQTDENSKNESLESLTQDKDSEWGDIFEDTSDKNGNEENPFLMEEMFETSKTKTSS